MRDDHGSSLSLAQASSVSYKYRCIHIHQLRYDFDLRTGKSETGLRACTYSVEVRADPEDGIDNVYMETPSDGSEWRLVELRPVSEGPFSKLLSSYGIC